MKGVFKYALLLVVVLFCLFEFGFHWECKVFREYASAFLSLQWLLLVCVAVWCGTFLFRTCSLNDLPLIGVLLVAVTAYFIGYATSQSAVDAITLLSGVTLGKGARFALMADGRWQMADGKNSLKIENRKSPIVNFLVGLVLLLAFSSWWHLDMSDNFYRGPRWMGLWNNPNDYGILMAAGLILAIGLLAAKRHKRHKETEKRKAETDSSPRPSPRLARLCLATALQARRGRDFLLSFATKEATRATSNVGQASRLPSTDANGDPSASPTWAGETPALRFILFIAAGMMGTGLLFSYSRGAWIGTTVGLLYLAKVYGKFKWRWVLPLILITVAAVWFFWNTPRTAPWYLQRLDMSRGSVQHRIAAWNAGFEIMRDHPFGVGWNKTVETYQKSYSPPEDGAVAITTNDYLMLGTQLGIPALLCFVAYVGLCFRGKCSIKNEEGRIQAACRAGALVFVVAFWFDGGLFKLPTAALFWVLLELGVAQQMPDPASVGKLVAANH